MQKASKLLGYAVLVIPVLGLLAIECKVASGGCDIGVYSIPGDYSSEDECYYPCTSGCGSQGFVWQSSGLEFIGYVQVYPSQATAQSAAAGYVSTNVSSSIRGGWNNSCWPGYLKETSLGSRRYREDFYLFSTGGGCQTGLLVCSDY